MRPTFLLLSIACGGAIFGCAAAPTAPPCTTETRAESTVGSASVSASTDIIAVLAREGFPDPSSPLAHASELAMFDDQAAPLRSLSERLRARVAELRTSRNAAVAALEAELAKADRDAGRVRALASEVARIDAESTMMQIEARLETRRILRPNQLVKLRSLRSATSL